MVGVRGPIGDQPSMGVYTQFRDPDPHTPYIPYQPSPDRSPVPIGYYIIFPEGILGGAPR